jgi:hypothetical protein
MTTGVTYRTWQGKPVLEKDGETRFVAAIGGAWTGDTPETALDIAIIRKEAPSIGEGDFADRFTTWGLSDLDGWFVSRGSTAPYDTYRKARLYASR